MFVKPAKTWHLSTLLLSLCCILGIVAPNSTKKIYKCYAIALMLLHVAGLLLLSLGKMFDPVFGGFTFLVKFFDHVALTFLTISCIATPLITIFLRQQDAKKLFDVIDRAGAPRSRRKRATRTLWAVIIAMSAISFNMLVTDSCVWVNSLGMIFYRYYTARNVQYCVQGFTLALYFWVVTEISNRFDLLNESLGNIEASTFHRNKNKTWLNNGRAVPILDHACVLRKLREVVKLHNFLCDKVILINQLFGMFVLFYILFSIFFVTQYMMILIIYTVLDGAVDKIQFGTSLQVVSCCWIIENVIKIFALAYIGDRVAREANSTITICYKLLNDMDLPFDSRLLREELIHLKDQITDRQPHLTASGFFVVDFTMIGFIISSITSYIIVSLQFMKN